MKQLYFFTIMLLCFACESNQKQKELNPNYTIEFEKYKEDIAKDRIKYLQLAGLFKLNTTTNSFGKNKNNTFIIPIETLPETIGTFNITTNPLTFEAAEGSIIKTALDSTITKMKMTLDEYGNSEKLYHDRLNWQLITRGNAPYLRVWDTKHPFVENFKGFKMFDLNPDYIFDAQFNYFTTKKTEEVKSQLGIYTNTKFLGQVTFTFQNESYILDVGENGFTMVSDATTGDDTYGGGRYIYLDLPETDGAVTLDFNRLYNPPCSFSKYTTCLYPPRQNHLPFKIEAGELINRN